MMVGQGPFAHSTTSGDTTTWEPLATHLNEVARLAGSFAAAFDAGDWGRLLGWLHDWGKASTAFQKRLQGGPATVHATAGAVKSCSQYGNAVGRLLAYPVAGHHAGLPDWGVEELEGSLACRLARERLVSCPDPPGITLPPAPAFPGLLAVTSQGFTMQFFIRMLFSCLVDADWSATAAFYGQTPESGTMPSLGELRERLETRLDALMATSTSPIKAIRREVLMACRERAQHPPGWFSLTVPTGGGKTLSSLDFALRHAERHGLRRVIYAIPFTSIIDQNAAIFRETLGEAAVLEHHAAMAAREDEDDREKVRRAVENWEAPVVVTTNVQFFESLFASQGSRCRKLHNIAGSVVILDEAQTLPVELLRPALAALRELVANYRVSVVLCTATQPALEREAWFPEGLTQPPTEIIPDPAALFHALRRTRVMPLGTLGDDDLLARLAQHPQVLVIVNTRRHAQTLWSRLGEGAHHLSTRMCPAHRRQVLATIREALAAGRPCRVVSTSLIEAGVDVDFPVVYRAVAGLDAMAQAAGRCNREGRDPEPSPVYVFIAADVKPPQGPMARNANLGERFLTRGDPLLPENQREYFKELYELEDEDGLDRKEILKLIDANYRQMDFSFRTISERFRLIDNDQEPLVIPWDARARELIDQVRRAPFPGRHWRQLQPYVVTLYPEEMAVLRRRAGVVATLAGCMELLVNQDLYHPMTGLAPDDPVFREAASNLF